MYLAQLYFVIGHIAIKKLIFLDQVEQEFLEAISSPIDDLDDLAQVTGGTEELMKQYRDKLRQVKENHLIPVNNQVMYTKFYTEVQCYVTNLERYP